MFGNLQKNGINKSEIIREEWYLLVNGIGKGLNVLTNLKAMYII